MFQQNQMNSYQRKPINYGNMNYLYLNETDQLIGKIINTHILTQKPVFHIKTGSTNEYLSTEQTDYNSYNECINKTKKYIKELQKINVNIKFSER